MVTLITLPGSRFNLADLSRTICSCLFPGSEVSGRPLPKGENALHRTLQEKRDQFQAKVLLAFECISPYFSTSTRSLFLNSNIFICDKKQADSAVVVLLGSLWTPGLRA